MGLTDNFPLKYESFNILIYNVNDYLHVSCLLWSDLLRQRQLFHTTYKMYMVSIGLWTFSLLLYSIAYGKYANTGYKEHGTEYAGINQSGLHHIYCQCII